MPPPPPKARQPATMSAADFRAAQAKPTAKKPASSKKAPSPANALTKSIIALLRLRGCAAWRQNNAAVYDPTRQVFRAGSSTPGISDVLGYHRTTGRFVAVEIKWGTDKLSDEQRAFLAEVRAAGGFACEGRSLHQVEAELNAWLAALPTS